MTQAEPDQARTSADRMMVRAARLHYEYGMTHQEVAAELGLSRVKVTRLIGEARRVGVVTITVHDDARPYGELEFRLAKHLGLADVRIAAATNGDQRRDAVAIEAANHLAAELPLVSKVAIGVSATVAEAVSLLPAVGATETLVIPMAGGWAGPNRTLNPDNLANQAALALGAEACSMPAPLVTDTPELAQALIASPGVAAVLRLAAAAEVLVIGVGVAPGQDGWDGALLDRALSDTERDQLQGAAGDISGRFFDAAGQPVPSTLDDRVVGLTLPQMRAIPSRVALAHGVHKVAAIRAAATGGLISVLITDRVTAAALLAR